MSQKPAVIVVSSHVARGSVGNRAAVFALEAFAYPVWAIPTVLLPWHPGHGPATRLVHAADGFDAFLNDVADAPWISEVGAILTGYMANAQQARAVASMVSRIKEKNANVLHVCDPVIGDAGGLYVPQDTAAAIRDALVPLCDVATPNRFELAWLLDETASETISGAIEQAGRLGPAQVLVTSVSDREDGLTGNLLAGNGSVHVTRHPSIPNPPNGPGDLTAATFLAHLLDGIAGPENLALTTASVFEILQSSARRNSDELTLERDVASLLKAETQVECYSPGENP